MGRGEGNANMLTLDGLRAYGANVDEGMGRCFNNEAFYLRLVGMGLADKNFDKLDEAIAAGDASAAFEAAHGLKGAIGNLALTPIYTPISALTEALRGKNEMGDVSALHAQVNAALAEARKLVD